jgi:hypothetical protein
MNFWSRQRSAPSLLVVWVYPGVIVGAQRVDLPNTAKFAEFRFLVYGAFLVGMMLYKPEARGPKSSANWNSMKNPTSYN